MPQIQTNSKSEIMPKWITISEAIYISKQIYNSPITDSDIYRNALCGDIILSIYFQSPVIVRKVQKIEDKFKLKVINTTVENKNEFISESFHFSSEYYSVCTEGKYICPNQQIIDTWLVGHEHSIVKILLAESLNIPLPITSGFEKNLGISVAIDRDIFQLFEKRKPHKDGNCDFPSPYNTGGKELNDNRLDLYNKKDNYRNYIPLVSLPSDACFVIRQSELEKFHRIKTKDNTSISNPSRISTPLSRLFWLACKNNNEINQLMKKPYKLLSIFEQWASAEGMTDRFSGDTLKNALERGSPL